MASERKPLKGPNLLTDGVALSELTLDTPYLGHDGQRQIVLVKHTEGISALSATCTHYGGNLGDGIVAQGTIRCPLHHAQFDVLTGLNIKAPGLGALSCFKTFIAQGRAYMDGGEPRPALPTQITRPDRVTIVGSGGAGIACAETLRQLGYTGRIAMIGLAEPFPVDRPSLSKAYIAGDLEKDDLPTRHLDWLHAHDIEFIEDHVLSISTDPKILSMMRGKSRPWSTLVLATGAAPKSVDIPGGQLAMTLRSMADADAIIDQAEQGHRAVIIGASFIGLEVAAALKTRGLGVTVVAPETIPLGSVMGQEVGAEIQRIHESKGVVFRLGRRPVEITPTAVLCDDGVTLPCDFVIQGVGVTPRTELAASLGLEVDDGIVVNAQLRTAHPDIWAAGDVAKVRRKDEGGTRIEHWVVAQRQGQTVARNLIGQARSYDDVPFFWSKHFGVFMRVVGHTKDWDEVVMQGDLQAHDVAVFYKKAGAIKQVLTIGQDLLALKAEYFLSVGDEQGLRGLLTAG